MRRITNLLPKGTGHLLPVTASWEAAGCRPGLKPWPRLPVRKTRATACFWLDVISEVPKPHWPAVGTVSTPHLTSCTMGDLDPWRYRSPMIGWLLGRVSLCALVEFRSRWADWLPSPSLSAALCPHVRAEAAPQTKLCFPATAGPELGMGGYWHLAQLHWQDLICTMHTFLWFYGQMEIYSREQLSRSSDFVIKSMFPVILLHSLAK